MTTEQTMTRLGKLILASALIVSSQASADTQVAQAPGADVEVDADYDLAPPSAVEVAAETPRATPIRERKNPLATTRRLGGGVRFTGLSGIGALPGVNYGGEVAALVRYDELFGELAMGHWKPEKTYVLAESPERVELGLDVWTLRGGWASMQTPLRMWGLVEVGELASTGAAAMPGVVPRMVMGETPSDRRWKAVGGGLGVAWQMNDNARLIGMLELAIPVARRTVMLDNGVGGYEPDPLAVRSCAGIELGWR